jgi:hypothetical protein
MGRPRKFCPNCTPRSSEDKAASREYWASVQAERIKEHNRRLREQVRDALAERHP